MSAAVPIEFEAPKTEAIQARIDPLVIRAKSFAIGSDEVYKEAAAFLRDCKTMEKDIVETLEPAVTKAHEAHKAATALRSKLLAPVKEAEGFVKTRMAEWVNAQEAKAREERKALEAIARKAEEDRRVQEAADLEAAGLSDEAEAVIAAPAFVPVVQSAPKVSAEGIAPRKKYSARVTDREALIRAAAAGKVAPGLVIENQKALDALARALGESFSIPGVVLESETVISARGR